MRAEVLALWLVTMVAVAAGCRGESKGFGKECGGDDECASALCITTTGQAKGFCTKSCRRNPQCPRGYSCSGATAQGVVVCVRGGGAPFLPAN